MKNENIKLRTYNSRTMTWKFYWKGIMYWSLPKSTLYGTTDVAWCDNVFQFAVMTECLLLKVMEFMLNRIYIHLINIVFIVMLFFLWVDAAQLFVSITSADLFEVAEFSACCTHLSICSALCGQMNGTTVLASLFHGYTGLFLQLHLILPLHCVS